MSSEVVYIALGSNLKNPVENIRRAIVALGKLKGFSLCSQSRLYRSPPMGPQDQPDYINAVVSGETAMRAIELLSCLQQMERSFGRKSGGRRWGERELDLDILAFGRQIINIPRLQVPHIGIAERAFVLMPLADIDRELILPGLGTVDSLLKKLPVEQLNLLERL